MKKIICLIIKSGPLRGHQYFVNSDCPVMIGRAQEANIRISEDKFCSRSHAVVFWEKNACYVKDLGSTNGTFVNKVKVVGNVKVTNQDIVSFGKTNVMVFIADRPQNGKPLIDSW